ncbi:MAG TPA: class I SAM-dependent methyltransferase [Bacteroidetes bacterium]|nr:class I SAM-dependent methyltransferase [Bacteroidota bacterium]
MKKPGYLRNWEGLARTDPLWSVCTCPDRKNGKWDREEFFETGRKEWERIVRYLSEQHIDLPRSGAALDFGCGVGRLSRAMAGTFSIVTGLDASAGMIHLARKYHAGEKSPVRFVYHDRPGLSLFGDHTFDFILALLVLQHIPVEEGLHYLGELGRVLKPGGILLLQVPVADCRRRTVFQRIRSVLRIRQRLALAGIGKGYGMDMHLYSPDAVEAVLSGRDTGVIHRVHTNHTEPGYAGDFRVISPEQAGDYLSVMMVGRKEKEGG